MSLEITALKEEHLVEAAKLVCERYQALREGIAVLPARYEEPEPILEWLSELSGEADGVVAMQDGSLVGFLTGPVIPNFMGVRSAYSPVWGNAAAPGHSRRIYEEMYARLSDRWVQNGCLTHVVSLMAHESQALEAWHWLGFGMINVDGVRPLTPLDVDHGNVEVRRADLQDAGILSELGQALERHEAAAPTFWLHDLGDFGETLGQPGNAAWLAYKGDQILGFLAIEPGDSCECALLQDPKTVNISGAYTIEARRGKGAATALLDQALAWARAQGYQRCSVDFESMNTLAAHFWMHWFELVSFSLIRNLDMRTTSDRSQN